MPRSGAGHAADLGPHADAAELVLDAAFDRAGQFGHGEFMRVAARFGGIVHVVVQQVHASCSLVPARLERRKVKRKGGR